MFRTLHRVAIDIPNIPYRPCRPFQERIAEYGMSGKPLFEWDKMRERWFIRRASAIAETCGPCPINIFGDIEGCRGEIEGLTIFLKVLLHLRPESPIFKYRFQQDLLSHDETRVLMNELHRVQELMTATEWPVAQVLVDGYPKTIEGPRNFVYYEWEGDEDETFIYSNDGYTVGIAKEGLVVKDAAGSRQPYYFAALRRVYNQVAGETIEGQEIGFDAVRDAQPAWDDELAFSHTELVYGKLPAADLFSDLLTVLSTCAEIAVRHNTGIRITLLN